jgi:SM-20-related protein
VSVNWFALPTCISRSAKRDSLLVFPSSARHEVETISCPGGAFADSRFAVNIWLCG